MQRTMYALMTAATLSLAATSVQAMPVAGGALGQAADSTGLIEKTAVYLVEGRRYCFYFNGWHGAGWYRCGFAWRRGIGWGGVYGWQGWDYGPAARRYGHRGGGSVTIREGRGDSFRDGGRRDGGSFRSESREGGSFRGERREGTGVRGSIQQRSTTTTGQGPQIRGSGSFRGEGGGGQMNKSSGSGGGAVQMNKSSGQGGGSGGAGPGGAGQGGGSPAGGSRGDKQ